MITAEQINDAVKCVEFHHFRGTTMVACCLTLNNGHAVLGRAAAANPDEFDQNLGMKYAREDADAKVATLLAFVEREVQGAKIEH